MAKKRSASGKKTMATKATPAALAKARKTMRKGSGGRKR